MYLVYLYHRTYVSCYWCY